jgi:Sigma-70, region 4
MPKIDSGGSFISEAEYARRLDRAVRGFQRRVSSLFSGEITGELRTIYTTILAQEPKPVTREEIACLIYDHENTDSYTWSQINRRIHGRLSLLAANGLLYPCGRVMHPYYTGRKKKNQRFSMSYRAVLQPDIPRFQQARERLYATVDYLNLLRDKGPALFDNAQPRNRRETRMIVLRARGMSLRDIGKEFGITDERVRQIVARALAPIELAKPVPPPRDQLPQLRP